MDKKERKAKEEGSQTEFLGTRVCDYPLIVPPFAPRTDVSESTPSGSCSLTESLWSGETVRRVPIVKDVRTFLFNRSKVSTSLFRVSSCSVGRCFPEVRPRVDSEGRERCLEWERSESMV